MERATTTGHPDDGVARALPAWVAWGWTALAVAVLGGSLLVGDGSATRVRDVVVVAAVAAAVFGVVRHRPGCRLAWWLLVAGIALSGAGDLVHEILVESGASSGFPYADILYLPVYPCLALAFWRFAGPQHGEALLDTAIVAIAAVAVVWRLVVTPVATGTEGPTAERIVALLYPAMDVLLLVAAVYALLAVPRVSTSARLLFAGVATMLVADTVYARLVAEGTFVDGTALDTLWPLAYVLMAGAALHPSMLALGARGAAAVREWRARAVVLSAALVVVPASIVVETTGANEAVVLTAVVGATAVLLAWRIARLVTDNSRAREETADREARFRALLQHSSDAIAVLGPDGAIRYVSPSVTSMLGHDVTNMHHRLFTEYVHPADAARVGGAFRELLAQPTASASIEARARHADGSWRWLEVVCSNQLDDPAVLGMVANFRDVTARKRGERASAAETRVLELILQGAPLAETLHALAGAVEEFVGDVAVLVRLRDAEHDALRTVAAPTLPLEYVRVIDEDAQGWAQVAASEVGVLDREVVIGDLAADGTSAELQALALAYGLRAFWSLPVPDLEQGGAAGFLGVYSRTVRTPAGAERAFLDRARDLVAIAIDRAAHTEQLGFLARHDTLTTLPNRTLGIEHLDTAIAALPESGPLVAVLFCDLDRFKTVNDGFGHDTGDELLVAVGRRLAGAVRRHDTVARFGGDEFVVVCERVADEEQACELAERLLRSLERPFRLARAEVAVTASIGVALTHRANDGASALLRDADAAMYRAKSRGGGRFEVFDDAMHSQAVGRLLTERALRQSLDEGQLHLRYQPQFDLRTGERVALEALLRWDHPVRGPVAAAEFLAVAEDTGLVVPMGEWVVDEVARWLASVADGPAGASTLPVSINVAARQLVRPGFADDLRARLAAEGVAPSAVGVEVAEGALLGDADAVGQALAALKDLGVRLAIDDFGTGGSSLTYLRKFPFDELKIDGTFIAGLGRSAADDAIVAATIDMAHALGMTVSAEGIETAAQRDRLLDLGCDRGQGYLLGAPEVVEARHLRLVHRRLA